MKKLIFLFVVLMVSSKAFCQSFEELTPYLIPFYTDVKKYEKFEGKYLLYCPIHTSKLNNKLGTSPRLLKVEDISAKLIKKDNVIKTHWTFDTDGPDLELYAYLK